jgi:hypothetical protein
MNTFLPYADFMESAKVLDKKRCWKQVVEAKQIIDVLELKQRVQIASDGHASIGKTIPWSNHPAVKMWEGYILPLKRYYNIFLNYCVSHHRINTKLSYMTNYLDLDNWEPWWLGNEDFHRAMRSRLIEKDREFYLPLFPKDEGFNGGKYFWPVMENKTFRTI